MKREAVAVLLGLALGLLAGLAWQGHRAAQAEQRAHVADSLYQATAAREVVAQSERESFDRVRRASQAHADSVTRAADDSLAAVRGRAAKTTARAAVALAAAATIRDTAETYKSLYEDAASERDDALRAAESQRRAVGELRAMLAADSVEIGKERARTADWKRAADSLDLANADLMKHRRPGFSLKVGLGGFAAGAASAVVVALLR